MWEDYDLEDESKWFVMEAPPLNSAWVDALTRIAGKNPFGKPILVARWAATYNDPMAVTPGLKYWIGSRPRTLEGFMFTDPVTGMDLMVKHDSEIPPAILVAVPKYCEAIELGERRWVIERWRSSEFLARSGRYTETSTVDGGASEDFVFCRGCHAELTIPPDGKIAPCANCGSKRHYVKTEREDGHGQLLKTNPAEGAYDFFTRLEFEDGSPAPADERALEHIRALWQKTQQSQKEKLMEMLQTVEPQVVLNERATSPTNPFLGPTVR